MCKPFSGSLGWWVNVVGWWGTGRTPSTRVGTVLVEGQFPRCRRRAPMVGKVMSSSRPTFVTDRFWSRTNERTRRRVSLG